MKKRDIYIGLGFLAVLAALGAAIWWWPTDPGKAMMVAVAVLIVTCPCALSLATPVAMLTAAGTLARSGVLVRNLQGLEALAADPAVVARARAAVFRGERTALAGTQPLTLDDVVAAAEQARHEQVAHVGREAQHRARLELDRGRHGVAAAAATAAWLVVAGCPLRLK